MFTIRAASSLRTRAIVAPTQRTRLIHASPVAYKTVTEKVAEVADKVNKSVGKGLADAIDKGEKATDAAKDTIKSTTEDTEKKAKETSTTVKHKANQAQAGAREAKKDFEREVKK